MNLYSWLGADAPDANAWGEYLLALRDKMTASWSRAETAYVTLKQVREGLGLLFIDDSLGTGEGGSAASHGAWTSDLETQAQSLHAMSTLCVQALNEAVEGKRKVFYNNGNLAIEALDSDLLRLTLNAQGVPELVGGPASGNPGQPVEVNAPIGVGIPALVWLETATVSVLALPAYFVADAAINMLTDVAEQKTIKTVAEKSYDCVNKGNCTPEQVAEINKSIFNGAAGVRKAKAEEEEAKNKPSTDWAKAVTTLGFVALGLGALYVLVRFVPAPAPRSIGAGPKLLPAPGST